MNIISEKNTLNKIVFDGQVYAQRITGQYRYADEILTELDKLITKNEFELIVPNYVNIEGKFKNIKVIHYGNVKGIAWTQTSLAFYLIKNKAISFGFCNITPLIKPGISVIHDVGYKVLTTHYKNLYGRLSSLWHRLNYWVLSKSGNPIITVSDFSRSQISDIYKVGEDRINVVSCGWQHFSRIKTDESVFSEHKEIKKGNYYFALGSLEERKNFKWILEVAKKNIEDIFVIAGGSVKNAKDALSFNEHKNVFFVGYLSDGKIKALMTHCKAFLFPSTFEGFGVPPLEAMSVGAPVLCSNSACLPEIYENSVLYIDPYDYGINLSTAQINNISETLIENTLQKYSWEKSAKNLLKILRSLRFDKT